jgi:transposase
MDTIGELREASLRVINPRCAGLDVHKDTVVACRLARDIGGKRVIEIRTFGTTTADILALLEWLEMAEVTHVAMESTGVYWRPIWNLLEGNFELILVNPRDVKQVPGRKTDANDAQWIAELLEHGLLRASFVPPASQRALREMTRMRSTLVHQRAELVNRVQKILETANIKLGSVATDVLGVSGRAMIDAMVSGETDPKVLAAKAVGRLRKKSDALEKALEGKVEEHHRLILEQLLALIDGFDKSIDALDEKIDAACGKIEQAGIPFSRAVAHLDTIPGVGTDTAKVMVSEMGTDMSRFPTADHACAWTGVAPGNNESAGKRRSGRTRPGNRSLKTALVVAAHSAARTKNTYLSALYRRVAARRGKKRAIVAVAHAILKMAYHMIIRDTDYHELGADYFDKLKPKNTAKRLITRLTSLGYTVSRGPETMPVAA